MVDLLYAQLNSRGKKQFKPLDKKTFIEHFSDYANLGLPAHKAALDGNVEGLKECFCSCLKEGGVRSRDINGATPLHLAARSDQADVVKWLLRFTDLSPTITAKHGETPAHVAAAQGHYESLKLLLTADGKGDVKSKLATAVDNSGFTVLHLAIVKNRNDCAKFLISEFGSKAVNALNESGVTAVHLAASAGNVEVLQFLSTKHKKLFYQEDKEGASPVYYAAQEGRLKVLKFMCEKCKCDLTGACKDGLKPIHAASQCGHTNIVKYIVSRIGDQVIFDTTPDGATPLHFSTSTGKVHTAQWLINSDAGDTLVSKKDNNGDTPAHDAAESGHVPMLKLLLESGADLYAINNDGNTPYSFALSGGSMDTANYVMTYASRSPQRDSGDPVRIYNMKGEVDVVEVNKTSDSRTPPRRSSMEVKESNKKDKKKAKQLKTSRSFLENVAQVFHTTNSKNDNVELGVTENELAMFGDNQVDNQPLICSPHHADEDIVVRYKGTPQTINRGMSMDEPGYATVKEIDLLEERREKKMKRRISKSIQKAINPEKVKRGKKTQSKILSEPMGFKPQFHSNPLMKLGGSVPPPPPPTPATGTSIAPNDEAMLDEVEYDNSFDPYATPDLEVVRRKVEQRQLEQVNIQKNSENQKLLKDALQDLSGDDDSPPEIPKQRFENVPSHVTARSRGSDYSLGSTKNRANGGRFERASPESIQVKLRPPETKSVPQATDMLPLLKSVKCVDPPNDGPQTELSRIKLKKAADWKRPEYSHPEKETTSGASDELKNILKKKSSALVH